MFVRVAIVAGVFLMGLNALAQAPDSYRPQRIIPLTPALAELAADLLGDDLDRIVGVTEYADEPPALKKKANVGPYHRLHIESLLNLKPDLVIASSSGNSKDQIKKLETLGVRVLIVDANEIADIPKAIFALGKAMGLDSVAGQLVNRFEKEKEALKNLKLQCGLVPKVLIQIGWNPLIVVGNRGFLNESLKMIGVANAASQVGQAYPKISVESVFQWSPDQVLVLALSQNSDLELKSIQDWKKLGLMATLHRNDALARPSLRIFQGILKLKKEIESKCKK